MAQAELAERRALSPICSVTDSSTVDDDLLRQEDHVDGVREALSSKLPSSRRNFIRLIEARFMPESSTCMYSEQGLDALIRPTPGVLFQRLMVISY